MLAVAGVARRRARGALRPRLGRRRPAAGAGGGARAGHAGGRGAGERGRHQRVRGPQPRGVLARLRAGARGVAGGRRAAAARRRRGAHARGVRDRRRRRCSTLASSARTTGRRGSWSTARPHPRDAVVDAARGHARPAQRPRRGARRAPPRLPRRRAPGTRPSVHGPRPDAPGRDRHPRGRAAAGGPIFVVSGATTSESRPAATDLARAVEAGLPGGYRLVRSRDFPGILDVAVLVYERASRRDRERMTADDRHIDGRSACGRYVPLTPACGRRWSPTPRSPPPTASSATSSGRGSMPLSDPPAHVGDRRLLRPGAGTGPRRACRPSASRCCPGSVIAWP